jgi:hypothetical protein
VLDFGGVIGTLPPEPVVIKADIGAALLMINIDVTIRVMMKVDKVILILGRGVKFVQIFHRIWN